MRHPKDRIVLKVSLALTFAAGLAQAGVVLAPPPRVDNPPGQQGGPTENYPESSFGKPPAAVDLGTGPVSAAREAQTLDVEDDGTGRGLGGRTPASLQFTKETGATGSMGADSAVTALRPTVPDSATAIGRKGVQEVAIIAGDLGYFPKTVFVTRDIPVRMFVTGASKNTLCVMMDTFQVRRQVRSQKIEEITFTPAMPGKFRFYCPVNGMEGTMIVKEYSTAQLDH